MSASPIVIVGASLAGLRAAESLRRRGHQGAITLIGDEPHLPYDRPPLSKQLLSGEWTADRTRFRQKDGFDGLGLDMRLGRRVTALDASDRKVVLDDGGVVPYSGLVIATGARARNLPGAANLKGVHTLRTLDDALVLVDALDSGPRVAIIGAGFIGLEVASVCRGRGLDTTVIEMLPTPLGPILGDPMGERIADMHRAQGVTLRSGVRVTGLAGEGAVQGVELSDGSRVAAELVVVGIGVEPNVEWLDGSGVEVDDGVLCDPRCATNLPDVVAAGDVARWHNELFDSSMRVEHWTNAVEQANAAVARLVEGPEVPPFTPVPYFWSDQYDAKIQFAGHVQPDHELHVLGEGDGKLLVVYGRQDRLTGVLAINRPRDLIRFRLMIGKRATLTDALTPPA